MHGVSRLAERDSPAFATAVASAPKLEADYPRPMNGIFVAMTVMN